MDIVTVLCLICRLQKKTSEVWYVPNQKLGDLKNEFMLNSVKLYILQNDILKIIKSSTVGSALVRAIIVLPKLEKSVYLVSSLYVRFR